jgi:hypothetical protein
MRTRKPVQVQDNEKEEDEDKDEDEAQGVSDVKLFQGVCVSARDLLVKTSCLKLLLPSAPH